MKKGYLKLMCSEIDLVHYILIDETYYTLTRDHVIKVYDIKDNKQFYIEFIDSLKTLEDNDEIDPYFINASPLTDEDIKSFESNENIYPVEIELISDQKEVMDFHNLSVKEDFYYFKDILNEEYPVLLMKYKIKNKKSSQLLENFFITIYYKLF